MRHAHQRGALCAHGELRNRHFSGDFVPAAALSLGAAKTVSGELASLTDEG